MRRAAFWAAVVAAGNAALFVRMSVCAFVGNDSGSVDGARATRRFFATAPAHEASGRRVATMWKACWSLKAPWWPRTRM